MIIYRVALCRNSDQRIHLTRWQPFNGDALGLEYWYEEGNCACDCNRHGEFERVADPDYDGLALNIACGHTEYSLIRIEIAESFSVQPSTSPR